MGRDAVDQTDQAVVAQDQVVARPAIESFAVRVARGVVVAATKNQVITVIAADLIIGALVGLECCHELHAIDDVGGSESPSCSVFEVHFALIT